MKYKFDIQAVRPADNQIKDKCSTLEKENKEKR